jgi:hypothetical protein
VATAPPKKQLSIATYNVEKLAPSNPDSKLHQALTAAGRITHQARHGVKGPLPPSDTSARRVRGPLPPSIGVRGPFTSLPGGTAGRVKPVPG